MNNQELGELRDWMDTIGYISILDRIGIGGGRIIPIEGERSIETLRDVMNVFTAKRVKHYTKCAVSR